MSTPITGLTNLGTPQPTMLLYAALSPFGVTDDRKITANALLATITANISDVSLQFDNGQATATVSAAGKGKIRYNNLTGTFQQSINGAAYVDIGGGGAGTPGAPLNSVQYNAGAGVFGGNAGFTYDPTAATEAKITAQDNAHIALQIINSALPTVPQVEFTNAGGTKRMQVSMAGAAGITDTFDEVSIFSSVAALTLSMGIWNAIDTGEAAEFYLYTGAAGLNHTRLRSVDPGATNVNWLDIASSGVLMASNASPGGLILLTDLAAPIVFVTGGTALGNEKGRFDATGFTLGHVSTITGALNLANAASAFLTTITAGNAAAARTYVWPTNFGASGSVLTDAAGNGTLSWAVPAAGGMAIGGTVTSGTAGSVLFVNAGPILAQDNANFFWDDTNNRLGLGTATPAKLLHVNGIAQLGTVSATTGQLQLANSASANLTTIQAGNAAAAITYTWPTNVGAAGSALTDAAGNGVLSWAAAAAAMAIGGTVTSATAGSVLFAAAGPVLAQNNASFFWDDANVRLGIGTNSPSDSFHTTSSSATVNTNVRITSTNASRQSTLTVEANTRSFNLGVGGASATAPTPARFFITDLTAGQIRFLIDTSGQTAINGNTSAPTGTLHVFGHSASNNALTIAGIANQTAGIPVISASRSAASSSTISSHTTLIQNANGGSGSAGLGGQLSLQLNSSTTTAQDAVACEWLWTTATHASRSAAYAIRIVDNAVALAEKWRIAGNGAGTATVETLTGVNGATIITATLMESVTLSTVGATTDSTIDLPANAIILSVTARITTTIANVDSTALQIGDPTTATRFSDATSALTSGTTLVGLKQMQGSITTDAAGPVQTATAKVRLTLAGGADNTPSAGVVRITIMYMAFAAPTS